MGNAVATCFRYCPCCAGHGSLEENYTIYVKTGDQKGAGTDANAYVKLKDEYGNVSDAIKLSMPWVNNFEKGSEDTFHVSAQHVKGDITEIELWRDKFGISPDWHVERVIVQQNRTPHHRFYFPVHRWIREQTHYHLRLYDTSLPQLDKQPQQRKEELKVKREIYQYTIAYPGLPVQIKKLPHDEQFSDDYKWDIVKRKASLILNSKLVDITTDCWKALDDIKQLYKWQLPVPKGYQEDWRSDARFGMQRINGSNNQIIQVCHTLPANMKVTKSDLESHLEGHTLEDMFKSNRLFYTDHRLLQRVIKENNCHLCSPLALFYLNNKNKLMPIAIQLEQEPGTSNPVFYPTDNPYIWLSAKIWYNNADAQYHQSVTHLGTTHMLMESVSICTHRNLSPSHPIFKLLAPHFLFLLAINTRGLQKLVNPGGWVDSTTTVGRIGMFEVMKRGVESWSLDRKATVIHDLADRGFLDLDVLPENYWTTPIDLDDLRERIHKFNPIPGYYWRDDALLIFEAIKIYVLRIVTHHYGNEQDIINDTELQSWAKELSDSKESRNSKGEICGCGIHGVPGGGKIESYPDLIQTLTAIIFTSSVSHASSFSQYDEYAFPPNYPGILRGKPPMDKKMMITEQDILNVLPNKQETLDIMVITKLLSEQPTNSLGDFEVQYLYDPESTAAADKFRKQLHQISKVIRTRNENADNPYPWLDPETIPNSISI